MLWYNISSYIWFLLLSERPPGVLTGRSFYINGKTISTDILATITILSCQPLQNRLSLAA
jgi:hypothetical protein